VYNGRLRHSDRLTIKVDHFLRMADAWHAINKIADRLLQISVRSHDGRNWGQHSSHGKQAGGDKLYKSPYSQNPRPPGMKKFQKRKPKAKPATDAEPQDAKDQLDDSGSDSSI